MKLKKFKSKRILYKVNNDYLLFLTNSFSNSSVSDSSICFPLAFALVLCKLTFWAGYLEDLKLILLLIFKKTKLFNKKNIGL